MTMTNPEPIRANARETAWTDPLTETGDEDWQNFDRAEIRAQEAIMREEQEAEMYEIQRNLAAEPGTLRPDERTCTCVWEDDGGPEDGPHVSLVEEDEYCPRHGRDADPEGWAEGDARVAHHEESLRAVGIDPEAEARRYEEVAVELDACEPSAFWLKPGVSLTLVTEEGPAGWPVVRIAGPRDLVRAYVGDNWGDEEVSRLTEEGEL